MNNSDYAFFSFGDDESSKIESEVYKDYLRYMKAESELEVMIFDGVLDVYVDEPNVPAELRKLDRKGKLHNIQNHSRKI